MRIASRSEANLTLDNILNDMESIVDAKKIFIDMNEYPELGPSHKNKYFLVNFGMLFALMHFAHAANSPIPKIKTSYIELTPEKSYYNVAHDTSRSPINQLDNYIINPDNAFLISPVRVNTFDGEKLMLSYIKQWKDNDGFKNVYYPLKDTDQTTGCPSTIGTRICRDNLKAMSESETIKYYFHPDSSGSTFDLGMYIMLKFHLDEKIYPNVERKLEVITPKDLTKNSNYGRLLHELSKITT